MRFSYNGHLLENDRINEVCSDIIKSYPEIPLNLAILIAALEDPINSYEYNPIIEFKRLYNMLFVLHNDPFWDNTCNFIYIRIKKVYFIIISLALDNSELDFINNVMYELNSYFLKRRIDFPVISEFIEFNQ